MAFFTAPKVVSPMPELNDYVTSKKAAEILGYHVNHIRRMVKRGYLEGLKAGHSLLVSKKSIESFIEKTEKASLQKHDRRKRQFLES